MGLSKTIQKICSHDLFFYGLLGLILLLRFFPAGFQYFPYMDDFNQMGIYHVRGAPYFSQSFMHYHLYAARPMAGLLDVFLWSFFFPHLEIAALLILVLLLFTIKIFKDLLEENNIIFGRFGAILVATFPLITESTYWLSASTRLVVGSFLAILAVRWLLQAAKEYSFSLVLGGCLIGLIAQGFYETVSSFYIVLFLGLFLVNYKQIKHKWVIAVPLVHIALLGLYYFIFRGEGNVAARGSLAGSLITQIKNTGQQISRLMLREGSYTFQYTLQIGLRRLWTDYRFIAVCLLFVSVALIVSVIYEPQKKGHIAVSLLACVALFIGSFAPFFLIDYGLLYFRNLYPFVLAIGILAGVIVRVFKKNSFLSVIGVPLSLFVVFYSTTANIFHVESMKLLNEDDSHITQQILHHQQAIAPDGVVWVFGAQYAYRPLSAPHFASSTAANWSLAGRVTVQNKSYLDNQREPFFSIEPILYNEPAAIDLQPQDLLLGILPNREVVSLHLENEILYTEEQNIFAHASIQQGKITLKKP